MPELSTSTEQQLSTRPKSSTALSQQAAELQENQGAVGQHSPGVPLGCGLDGAKAASTAVPMRVCRGGRKGRRNYRD